MSMVIIESSPSHVSTKYSLKIIIKPTHIKAVSWMESSQPDGNEIVNAPLSCYIVKWRNRKVATTGLVCLSNLTSSYDGNKK